MDLAPVKTAGSGRKVAKVKAELLHQIKLNNFPRGSMLPPERELPERFGVSYMTVRKAVSELVTEKYLERQPGIGTFVRRDISRSRLSGVLGVICPTWESPEVADFIIHASAVAELNGWCPKLFFCRFWEDRMIEEAWKSCDALWIIPPGPMEMISEAQLKMFGSFEKPVIFIGVAANVLGCDSVMGSSGLAIRMAMDTFKQAGHRRVAFMSQYISDNARSIHPDRTDYDYWRAWTAAELGDDEAEALFHKLEVMPYTMHHQVVYDNLTAKGRDGIDFTGLVIGFSLVWGVVAALTDLGLRIPEDVSIIALGDRQESAFYRPQITQIRKSLREHAEKAMTATDCRLHHRYAPAQCLLVDPELIEGKTVRCIK